MDSIRVGIRVRPLLEREKNGVKWVIQGENVIVPTTPGSAGFEFDHVFGESSTTNQIYSTITRPIVHSVMEGFNGTVFAYGQTSSGKTFTMMGTEEQPGVIPMAIQEIFEYMEEHDESEYIVRVSYLEIYKEGICDLLDPTFTDLKIREDRENHVRVHGLKEYVVTNIEEVIRVIFVGNINRRTGETKMNDRSSRSHAVLSITVESRIKDGDGTVKVASLNLVDLAGSERLNATGAAGKRAQEGIAINKSLFTLKQVISKLSEGNPSVHIPYRDSKLTHILKPSLGGNAKTAIICAVTPAESYETELTLNFAICAKKVKNRPIVNEVLGGEEALKRKLRQLEKENGELRCKLSSESESTLTEEKRKELTEQIEEKECRQSELEARIHSLEQIIIKSKSQPETIDNTGSVYKRRKTICPASLARGMGSPLLLKPPKPRHSITPVVTPDVSHRSVARVQRGVHFQTPGEMADMFQSCFNSSGFERELATEMIGHAMETELAPPTVNVRDLERRRTMFRCPTFVMDTPASNISANTSTGDHSLWHDSQAPLMVEAQVQTDSAGEMGEEVGTQTMDTSPSPVITTDADTQTEEETIMSCVSEPALAPPPPPPPLPDLNSSVCLCTHHPDVCRMRINMEEDLQFHTDEMMVVKEVVEQNLTEAEYELTQTQLELQAEREKSVNLQKKLGEMTSKLKEMEMASSAQEEYLMKLCQQSKMASHRQGDLEDKCSQLERDAQNWEMEREEWKTEREEWSKKEGAWEAEREEWKAEPENSEQEAWQAEREGLDKKQEQWEMERENYKMEQERWAVERENYKMEQEQWERKKEGWKVEREMWSEKLEQWETEREGWDKKQDTWEMEQKMEQEQWKIEKEEWKVEQDEWGKKQDAWEVERENYKMEQEQWEGEREEWSQKQEAWEVERGGWKMKQEEWKTEREGWETDWDRERDQWQVERRDWEREREQWETERGTMVSEISLLKDQLQNLHTELEKLPSAKRRCSEPPMSSEERKQLTALMDKLKVQELQRAQEAVCYLQEQLEEANATPPPIAEGSSLEERQRAEEELREREREILEKEEIISSLQSQLSTMSKSAEMVCSLESELRSVSEELEDTRAMVQVKTSALEQASSHVSSMEQRLKRTDNQLQETLEALQAKSAECDMATDQLTTLQREMEQLLTETHEMVAKDEKWEEKLMAVQKMALSEMKVKEEEWEERLAAVQETYTQAVNEMTAREEQWEQKLMAMQKAMNEMMAKEEQWEKKLMAVQEHAQNDMAMKEEDWEENLLKALEDADSKSNEALETQYQLFSSQLEEMKARAVASEKMVSALESELETMTEQLHKAQTLAQEVVMEMTVKEEAWDVERDELCGKNQTLETGIEGLTEQVTTLYKQLEQAQQRPSSPCRMALVEAEGKIRDLHEQNGRLKSQIQAQLTFQPSHTSAGAICCDSSGTVTSAAFYHMRGEMTRVREDKEKLQDKVEKLKKALMENKQLYAKEQEEVSRYRLERNIFRAKYLDLKERHAVVLAQSESSAVATPSQTPTAQPPPPTSQPPTSSSIFSSRPSQPPTSSSIFSSRPSQPPTSSSRPSQPPTSSSIFSSRPSQPPTSSRLLQPPSSHSSQPPITRPPSSQPSIFSQPPSSQPSIFSQPPSSQTSIFSQPPSSQPSIFSQPPSSQTSIFSQPPSSQPSIFSKPPVSSPPRSFNFSNLPPNSHNATRPPRPPSQPVPALGENAPHGVPGRISSMAPKRVGENSSVPPRSGVLHPANLGEQLWDMSIIQTAPQPPGDHSRDQNKCPQQ